MDFVQNNVNPSHHSINHLTDHLSDQDSETSFKQCLLASVWTQSRLVSSLLDQVGLAYHRVFNSQALDLFLVLINTDIVTCSSLDNFNASTLSVLNHDLLAIQSNLISSMDLFVVETLNNAEKQASNTNMVNKVLGKHHEWKSCAKSRFEQVICPILEQKLINKTP